MCRLNEQLSMPEPRCMTWKRGNIAQMAAPIGTYLTRELRERDRMRDNSFHASDRTRPRAQHSLSEFAQWPTHGGCNDWAVHSVVRLVEYSLLILRVCLAQHPTMTFPALNVPNCDRIESTIPPFPVIALQPFDGLARHSLRSTEAPRVSLFPT